MQVKVSLIVVPFLLCSNTKTLNKKIFFKDASLAYINSNFVLYFNEIDTFYETFELYINREIVTKLRNVKRFNYIELPGLIYNKQNEIELKLGNNNDQKRLFFNINLNSFYDLTYQEEFKMNSLIDDYNKIFSFIDLQYFRIENYIYEIANNQSFFEFDKIGKFYYNQDFSFCDKILFRVNKKDLFDDLIYNDGYLFHLNLDKSFCLNYSHVDRECLKGSNPHYQNKKLYFPLFLEDNLVEGEILFTSFAKSNITLKFDVIFDVNNIFFGELGSYQIYIRDIKL